jgi:hypothetical protein
LDRISCPNCGSSIPISETLSHQLAEKASARFKAESVKQQQVIAQRERELAAREEALASTVSQQVEAAKAALAKEASQKARSAVEVELQDLRRQADEKEKLLLSAQAAELELRQQKRLLEDREKALELEVARKLDEERRNIEQATTKRLDEEHRLRDAEKDKKLQDIQRVNEELRRKLQQGSQQTQGEVLELELETLLANTFPFDSVSPVPKGVTGADLVQKVVSPSGHGCGTIVWEAKRTKAWSDGWIQKLKDDQRALKAEIAVIVSEALPRDCHNFSHVNGVWVANPQCALNLATALRMQLIQVGMTKLAAVGKNEKMEVLYSYLSGPEFRQRVETIVEAFGEMQKDLADERKAAERRWAKREKQLVRVIGSTSGMYGDLQGLIGSSLPTIPALFDGAENAADVESMSLPQLRPRSAIIGKQADPSDLVDEVDDGEQESFSLRDFNRLRVAERQDG